MDKRDFIEPEEKGDSVATNLNGPLFCQEIKHTNDSVVNSVINRMIERSKIGEKKYNTTLDREDLSTVDWLNHLQEELIDAVQYIEKLKKTIK